MSLPQAPHGPEGLGEDLRLSFCLRDGPRSVLAAAGSCTGEPRGGSFLCQVPFWDLGLWEKNMVRWGVLPDMAELGPPFVALLLPAGALPARHTDATVQHASTVFSADSSSVWALTRATWRGSVPAMHLDEIHRKPKLDFDPLSGWSTVSLPRHKKKDCPTPTAMA